MGLQSKVIPIEGMHCKACTVMVAEELGKIPGVKHASVSLKEDAAIIRYTDEPSDRQIRLAVEDAGYSVGSEDKPLLSRDKSVYIQLFSSMAIVLAVLLVFINLGFNGINITKIGDNQGITALVVGITAGLSTCMALVGGLVLGLSAKYAENHQLATAFQKFTPHLFFNTGRIVTFFILGGLMGLFGSLFRLNGSIVGLLTIGIGVVMLVLGLQLTELFPRLANKGFTLPVGVAKFFGIDQRKRKKYNHKNAMLLGALTFFLPCGFTQAMQLVAIGSGDFITGSIVMGLFAIGTAPGLLGIGGLTAIVKGRFAKLFFRFVGILVILFAAYNISNGINLTGYKFDFFANQSNSAVSSEDDKDSRILKTTFSPIDSTEDISPSTFNVEIGKYYTLEVDAKGDGVGCMSTIMIPGVYENPILIKKGIVKMKFKINTPGVYKITCAMGIARGSIIATDGEGK